MKLERIKLKWPVALNTVDDRRVLLPNECSENYNLIALPDGSVRAHYNWAGLEFNDTLRIISGREFSFTRYPTQLIVFGWDDNGGFLGKINKGETTITKLLTSLGKYVVPCFVKYKNMAYISIDGYYFNDTDLKILKYDGASLTSSEIQGSNVSCEFRGRLWFADNGTLRFTDVGTETVGALNYMDVGNTDEIITNLIPLPNNIIPGKGNEVWELTYTTLKSTEQYASDAKLKCRTKKAGMLSHRTACRHFNTIYFYDDKGIYILNPQRININPEQLLEIDPGIVKISKPIDFSSFNIVVNPETTYEREPGIWSISDFDYMGPGVEIHSTYGVLFITPGGNVWEADAISKGIRLPKGYYWLRVDAEGDWPNPFNYNEITFFVSIDKNTWYEIPSMYLSDWGVYKRYIWNKPFPLNIQNDSIVYFKIHFKNRNGSYSAQLRKLKFSIKTINQSEINFGSGFHKDRFYIFAEDQNGDRSNLMFKDGWKQIQNDGYEIYNLCDEIAWTEDYSIIGFGKAESSGKGSLIKNPIPEDVSGNMTIVGETGNVDYDKADVPKKLRRIFITYKGTGINNLKIYREDDDLIKSINLPAKTDFGIEEINLQSDRSKWHRYKITSTKADFILKDFGADIKVLKPQEV